MTVPAPVPVRSINVPIVLAMTAMVGIAAFVYNAASTATALANDIANNKQAILRNEKGAGKINTIKEDVARLRTDVAVMRNQMQQMSALLQRMERRDNP